MAANDPQCRRWCTSSHSGTSGGQCVEVAKQHRTVWLRDSKAVGGTILRFAPGAWAAFLAAAAHGRL